MLQSEKQTLIINLIAAIRNHDNLACAIIRERLNLGGVSDEQIKKAIDDVDLINKEEKVQ